MSSGRVVPLLLALAIPACGGDAPSGAPGTSSVTVRDSAGVRIVENTDSAWTDDTRWRLADEPDLRIGSVDGSVPGTDLTGSILVRMLGDRVLVLDRGTEELRLFDAEGDFVRTLSRRGEGPNELQAASNFTTVGDTAVAVWDSRSRRVVQYAVATDEVVSHRIDPPPSLQDDAGSGGFGAVFDVQDFFADGSLLVRISGPLYRVGTGLVPKLDEWHRVALDGSHLDGIGVFPNLMLFGDGERAAVIPYSAMGTAAAGDELLWYAFPESAFRIDGYRPDGAMAVSLRLEVPLEPIGSADIAEVKRFREEVRTSRAQQAALSEAMLQINRLEDAAPFPEVMPPFEEMIVSDEGEILVALLDPERHLRRRAERLEPTEVVERWTVIDPEGRWLGTLAFPPGFALEQVAGGYAIGVRDDELGVPWIERYRIIEP